MIALKETGKNLTDLTRLYKIICIELIIIFPQLNIDDYITYYITIIKVL